MQYKKEYTEMMPICITVYKVMFSYMTRRLKIKTKKLYDYIQQNGKN